MSVRKQLVLAAVTLVLGTLLASATVLLWNGARHQIEEQALLIAAGAVRFGDPNTAQRLADSMAVGTVQAVRVVDAGLAPVAASGDGETSLAEADRAQLELAIRNKRPETFQDSEGLKVAAPSVDASGQVLGAAVVVFPPNRMQTAILSQVASTLPQILAVLLLSCILGCLYMLRLTKPLGRLDAAVTALGSYRFQAETLDDLAKRSNELGRMATLLQRMANAEQGWRRSLEGLRQAKDELEVRVQERTRDLTVALEQQTALNNQLQEMGLGLQRSGEELRVLAEVSQAVVATGDSKHLLMTIVSQAVRLSRSDAGTIYEFDERKGTFTVLANDGIEPDELESLQLLQEQGEAAIVNRAAMQRVPTQVADLWQETGLRRLSADGSDFRALLAVPLINAGTVVGELVVRRREPGDFEPETVGLLQTIALQSVLAVAASTSLCGPQLCGCSVSTPLLEKGNGALHQSVLHASRLADFRKERLGAIRQNEAAVELPRVPKVVLHLTPMRAASATGHLDLMPAVKHLAPFGRPFTSQGVNFDGVMTCERRAESFTAYAQGYWDGRIEMVDAILLTPWTDGAKQLPARALEDSVIRSLELCAQYYRELDISPPVSVGLALLGVKGYRLLVDGNLWSDMTNHPVERTDLIFPETTIEGLATRPEVTLRPLFDMLWNACGFERCFDYERGGEWKPGRSTDEARVAVRRNG